MRKRSNYRWIVPTLLGCSLLLAGCGSSNNGSTSAPSGDNGANSGKTMQLFLSGDANQGGGMAKMVAKYKEETGVNIEIVDIANDDISTKLKNAAVANDLPAMARAPSVDPVWKDSLVDLSSITDGSNIMMDLGVVDSDGKVLALPTDVTAVGMFINKSLFDKAGVSYPTDENSIWTWDEFVAAVNKVKDATGAKYGMAMDRSSHRLASFLFEFGSTSFKPNAEGTWETNDATKTALEYFKNLNDDSFMPRSVWLANGDGNAMFKSGDLVSYMSGSWQIADFAENIKDFEWASVYLPKQPVRSTNYGTAADMVVFEGPQQEEATAFVKWLYQPENYKELCAIMGALPAMTDLTIDYAANAEAFELYNNEIAASPAIVSELRALASAYGAAGLSTDGDPIRDETAKYLNDEQDVDATIANISEQLTDQLGKLP